jgi:hypothetical protein
MIQFGGTPTSPQCLGSTGEVVLGDFADVRKLMLQAGRRSINRKKGVRNWLLLRLTRL